MGNTDGEMVGKIVHLIYSQGGEIRLDKFAKVRVVILIHTANSKAKVKLESGYRRISELHVTGF